MSAAEFLLWGEFRSRFGFDVDRLEWTTANGLAAVCQTWGGKVDPDEIKARFGPAKQPSKKKLSLQLAGLPGAKVRFIPKDKTQPIIEGRAALLMLDTTDDRRKPLLLSEGERPDKPKKRTTLSGD